MLGECLDPGRVEIVVLDCSVFNIRYQLTEFLEYPHFEQMISSESRPPPTPVCWAGQVMVRLMDGRDNSEMTDRRSLGNSG